MLLKQIIAHIHSHDGMKGEKMIRVFVDWQDSSICHCLVAHCVFNNNDNDMWCCSSPYDRTGINALDKEQTLNDIYQAPRREGASKSDKDVPAALMHHDLSFHARYSLFAGEESLV